jgi:hypothetical protein
VPNVESVQVDLPLPATASCASVISLCTTQSGIIKKAPAYNGNSAVQTVVLAMDAAVALLQSADGLVTQTTTLLATQESKRDSQIILVRLAHDSVEAALNTASNGDPTAAAAWTGKTKTRAKPVPVSATTTPPETPVLRNVKSRPGTVEASCAEEPGAIGYVFQQGGDPAHPELWAPGAMTRGRTYKVSNLPIGQTVYLRIAIVRRGSIQSQWSPILQIVAR